MNDDGTKTTLNLWPVLACIVAGLLWYGLEQSFVAFVHWCGR